MKHYSIGLILFVLVFIVCMVLTYVVVLDLSHTEALLSRSIELQRADDIPAAAEYLFRAQHVWEQRQHLYRSVLNHDEIDLISGQFQLLRLCVETEQFEDLLCESADLMKQLEQLREICYPYYYNVL